MSTPPPSSERENRPLLSFLLFTYNQEEFVREAVMAALNQDYSPLEIIISDDCSTDGTFAIIEEITESYTGPHRLVVRKNPVNLGFIAHINHVIPMSNGTWIIMAAGDDISKPERVRRTQQLAHDNPAARSIFVGFEAIGETPNFRDLPKQLPRTRCFPETIASHGVSGLGACHAFHRDIWTSFGTLPPGLIREDAILPFRASLLGNIIIDNEVHVQYRVSTESLSKGYQKRPSVADMHRVRSGEFFETLEMKQNLATAAQRGLIENQLYESASQQISIMISTASAAASTLEGSRWKRLTHALRILAGTRQYVSLCGNWKYRISIALNAFK